MNKLINWLIGIWMYVISAIAGGIGGYLLVRWGDISTQKRLTCFFVIALVLHVLEEWVWPAGLHYIHNLARDSHTLDRYPMNQFSDMITNFVAVMIGLCTIWKFGDHPVAGITIAFFGILEVVAHTRLGVVGYKALHSNGLNFPYSPGLATSVFGFLIVSVFMFADLGMRGDIKPGSILCGILCLICVLVILVLIPENGLKDPNTPYAFRSNGFYEKYLKKD